MEKFVIAYEPLWAIGTGKTATLEKALEVHMHLRAWLNINLSVTVAYETRIIYCGTVSEKNTKDLIVQGDIDGFLDGGTSLKPAFSSIVESSHFKIKIEFS